MVAAPPVDSHPPNKLTPEQLRRSWRLVTIAGLCGMLYFTICVNSAPRVKFLTALNATPFDFGLIAALGSLVVAFQLVSGVLVHCLRHRKWFWFFTTIAHRMIFACVIAAPLIFQSDRLRMAWIVGVLFLHDALANIGSPLWFAWMADIVPRESFNRYWAVRLRFILIYTVAVSVLLAFAFNFFERRGLIIPGFMILAAIGVVLGVTDISLFIPVPEPPKEPAPRPEFMQTMRAPLVDHDFRPFLRFMSVWNFAVMISAPFFTVYIVEVLKLSAMTAQLIITAETLGELLATRFWGLLCDVCGQRSVLRMVLSAKAIVPVALVLVPAIPAVAIPLLLGAYLIDGILNAGFNLATQGMLLQLTPRQNRPMYIASTNFICLGVVGGLASFFSGWLIKLGQARFNLALGPWPVTAFQCAFLVSIFIRLATIPLAARLREANCVPVRTILGYLRGRNPLRLVREVYRLQGDPDEQRRARAARLLGELCSPLASSELIAALQDSSRAVRQAAAEALGQLGLAEASEPLGRALLDPTLGIQRACARALGRIGDFQSRRLLLANLRALEPEALAESIDSLARLGDEAAILPLICLYEEIEDEPLRQRIVRALGRLIQAESPDDVQSLLAFPQYTRI